MAIICISEYLSFRETHECYKNDTVSILILQHICIAVHIIALIYVPVIVHVSVHLELE